MQAGCCQKKDLSPPNGSELNEDEPDEVYVKLDEPNELLRGRSSDESNQLLRESNEPDELRSNEPIRFDEPIGPRRSDVGISFDYTIYE